jgi:lipoate-protein ligase A
VDHRDDWTYTLVIPRGHPLAEERASQSYRVVHECLAAALAAQGVAAELQPEVDPEKAAAEGAVPGVCFQKAERFDVVMAGTGDKIAGAAQKRNRNGMLFQGSVWKPAAGGDRVDWEAFGAAFAERLGGALGTAAEATPWPEFNEDEIGGLTEQYASAEWVEAR